MTSILIPCCSVEVDFVTAAAAVDVVVTAAAAAAATNAVVAAAAVVAVVAAAAAGHVMVLVGAWGQHHSLPPSQPASLTSRLSHSLNSEYISFTYHTRA